MPSKPHRSNPEAKSKTDLRRGQVKAGNPSPHKDGTLRGSNGTSREEEAMLFGEPPAAGQTGEAGASEGA
jgi:hypothetical protein